MRVMITYSDALLRMSISLKGVYLHLVGTLQVVPWGKQLWRKFIPPLTFLLFWRLCHDKVPINDLLSKKGLHMTSMCILCKKHADNVNNLFFDCCFAQNIWNWFAGLFNSDLLVSYLQGIFGILDGRFLAHAKAIFLSACLHIIEEIWRARNRHRFMEHVIHWISCTSSVISKVSWTGKGIKQGAHVGMKDFLIFKALKISIKPPVPNKTMEVLWSHLLMLWF